MNNYRRLYGWVLTQPEDVRPLLKDPVLHWKKGRSAMELATAWVRADGMPAQVSALIEHAPEWSNAEVAAGFFEHPTALDTLTAPSHSDLLLVCRLSGSLGVIAVEGKAGEPFGNLVADWNKSVGTQARLTWACDLFGIEKATALPLRWQLFHRTACAVLEAVRFHAPHAMVLVHDFGEQASGSDDFMRFADVIGVRDAGPGQVSTAVLIKGVSLRLAWLRDKPFQV